MRNIHNYLILWLLHALGAMPLPRRVVLHLGTVLHYIAALLPGMRRLNALSRDSLAHAFPDWDKARLESAHDAFWRSQACAAIYESPLISRKRYQDLYDRLDPALPAEESIAVWDGLEHIEATRAQPVIFSIGHMHSLEIATIAVSRQRSLLYIAKAPKVKFFAEVVRANRTLAPSGVPLHHRDMIAAHRVLRDGGALVVLGDQFVRPNNPVKVRFFNTDIEVQPTISRLALATGARVIAVYIRRREDFRFDISIKAPLELSADDHQHNSQLVFSHYEDCIRQAPEQYIWNHNRFFR